MTAEPATAVNGISSRFDLRAFVDELSNAGGLSAHSERIELADLAAVLEGSSEAVLFTDVGPQGRRRVGNVAGSRERLALAFCKEKGLRDATAWQRQETLTAEAQGK